MGTAELEQQGGPWQGSLRARNNLCPQGFRGSPWHSVPGQRSLARQFPLVSQTFHAIHHGPQDSVPLPLFMTKIVSCVLLWGHGIMLAMDAEGRGNSGSSEAPPSAASRV